jgi:hypothetical protein
MSTLHWFATVIDRPVAMQAPVNTMSASVGGPVADHRRQSEPDWHNRHWIGRCDAVLDRLK